MKKLLLLVLLPLAVVAQPRNGPYPTSGVTTGGTNIFVNSISNNLILWHGVVATPYPAISNALQAAVAGDLIYVYSGTYIENNLLTNGVNFYFNPGSGVSWKVTTTNTAADYWGIFDDRTCGPTTNYIGGHGTFIWQGYTNLYGGNSLASYGANCLGVVTITNSASKLTINCDSIQKSTWLEPLTTLTSAVVARNGQLILTCNSISDPYSGIGLVLTNLNVPHTQTKLSRMTSVYWELGTHRLNVLSNTPSTLTSYALWGSGVTTSDVCDFYYNGETIDGKIYVDSGSSAFRSWITAAKIENTTSNADAYGTAITALGSGKMYITAQKIMNSPGTIGSPTIDIGGGSLATTNYQVWIHGNPKITTSNSLFLINGVGSITAPLGESEDLAGVNPTNNVIGNGKLYYSAIKNPAAFTPTAITFPNTTVNWTNTTGRTISLFVDNTTVTGSAIKKNGTQIFGTVFVTDFQLTLMPYEYFSETYTVNTPTATFTPVQ